MRTLRIGALLTVTLVLLAACGSSGSSSATKTSGGSATKSSSSSAGGSKASDGSGSGSQSAFCDALNKAITNQSLGSGSTKEKTAATQKIYNDLAAKAPSEISGDVTVIRDAYEKYAGDYAALQKNAADAKKVRTASTHLDTYAQDKCKLTTTTS